VKREASKKTRGKKRDRERFISNEKKGGKTWLVSTYLGGSCEGKKTKITGRNCPRFCHPFFIDADKKKAGTISLNKTRMGLRDQGGTHKTGTREKKKVSGF